MAVINLELFGSSHGDYVGATLSGLPSGLPVNREVINSLLKRRAPGGYPWTTARIEDDLPEEVSGIDNDRTTGEVVEVLIRNRDVRRGEHDGARFPRPGHADFAAVMKYGAQAELSGGGRFSARLTAPLCFCGGLLAGVLLERGIRIYARAWSIGGICDRDISLSAPEEGLLSSVRKKAFPVADSERGEKMIEAILSAKAAGNSLGGIVQCFVLGLAPGSGGVDTEGLESLISREVFAIPGVKAVQFGLGFGLCSLDGASTNDEFYLDEEKKVRTYTNNSGGINGGLANGMPVVFEAGFRPTPSIALPQRTVDLSLWQDAVIEIAGRHDPCIVPRAVPVVESATAIALAKVLL